MKKLLFNSYKYFLCFCLSSIIAFNTNAQKLPNVQKEALRAPANIKIDGKITEWGNSFSAYNNATDIFYTIANDAQYLYITIQAKDVDVLTKVTTVGVDVMINADGQKKDQSAVKIHYPYYEGVKKPYIGFKNMPQATPGSATAVAAIDSVMLSWNKKLDFNAREIKVLGLTGVDTLLSIYNDAGIKAAQAFDHSLAYNCELAIPLKYISPAGGNKGKLAYHIILPGVNTTSDFGIKMEMVNGQFHLSAAPGAGGAIPSKSHLPAITSTTDFWGEYTLK
jgi:hypothetical protein